MALEGTDLLVVQDQSDSKLYKLKISDLISEIESSAGVNFKGSVDLNVAPGSQTPTPVVLPASNGDLYIIESNAGSINAGWVMQGGETSASEGDRIVYDGDSNDWVLLTIGGSSTGTVQLVTATLPLKSDEDPVNPVLTIREARTPTKATADGDGEGEAGAVARLAEAGDVIHTTGSGATDAVVTADLLKDTNEIVNTLVNTPGGVRLLTTQDVNNNAALLISPSAGDVEIEINTASDAQYGVVQLADAAAITAGTAGPSAVVDASQLNAAVSVLPTEAIDSITEGGTSIVAGALDIDESAVVDGRKSVTIGVNTDVFLTTNISLLPDLP